MSEFRLFDCFRFSNFRTEVKFSKHPETGAKVQYSLKETGCTQRGWEKE
ncbi:MAG: hypothetical protein WCA79_17785 [Anaerolineales bacterium]